MRKVSNTCYLKFKVVFTFRKKFVANSKHLAKIPKSRYLSVFQQIKVF